MGFIWVFVCRYGWFLTLVSAFGGTVFGMMFSGLIADSFSWPKVFYFFGAITMVWGAIWFWLVTDSPFNHSTITDKEVNYLKKELAGDHTEKKFIATSYELYQHLFYLPGFLLQGVFMLLIGFTSNKDIAVMELTLAVGFSGLIFSAFMVNHLDIAPRYAGLLLGFLFEAVFILLVGYASSKDIAILELTLAVGFGGLAWSGFIVNHLDIAPRYASLLLGFLFEAVFILLVGYASSKDIAILELTLAVGFGGLAWSGFIVNHLDIAPRYASLLLGISNCFATIPGILSPTIVGIITQNERLIVGSCMLYLLSEHWQRA
eukprot:gene11312-12496_t